MFAWSMIDRVYQDLMRAEHYRRDGNGFELEVLTASGDTLPLEAVDFQINLDRVYFDVAVSSMIVFN